VGGGQGFIQHAKQRATELENAHANQLRQLESELQHFIDEQNRPLVTTVINEGSKTSSSGSSSNLVDLAELATHGSTLKVNEGEPDEEVPLPVQGLSSSSGIHAMDSSGKVNDPIIYEPLGAASTWTSNAPLPPPHTETPVSKQEEANLLSLASSSSSSSSSSQISQALISESIKGEVAHQDQFMFYPVVTIMAHNRPEYMEKTLSKLLTLVQGIVTWKLV
jgi:hypothetical protein